MKKKMKKMFSKITTLVLLVAMLVPYTSIPKVEAATDSCENGEWEYHTNYYFFTQAEHPRTWANYFATKDGNNTEFSTDDKTSNTYYTSFLYNFPSDGTDLEITSANFVDLDIDGNISKIKSTSEWSVKGFYGELLKMYDSADGYEYVNPSSTYKEYSYNASDNNKGTSASDSIITYSIHGPWGFVGTGNNLSSADVELRDKSGIISVKSYNSANNTNVKETKVVEELTNASILPSSNKISNINIGVASGDLGNDDTAIDSIKSAIKDFNRDKGASTKAGIYKATTSKASSETTGDIVLKLYIRRSYNTNDFFNFNNIRIQTGGNYMESNASSQGDVDNLGDSEKLYFPEIDNTCDNGRNDCNDKSYVTKGNGTDDKVSKATAIKLRDESTDEYWFLAPSLFQISYKVCKASNEATEDSVTLTYKGNEPKGTVSNIPDIQTEKLNSEGKATVVVSSKTPELDGYKFKNWNTSANCDGTSIEPEAKLTLTDHKTLYACWGETGTTNNGKTGVATYAGLFTGIIALAGGSYYLIKKKNLFKKI